MADLRFALRTIDYESIMITTSLIRFVKHFSKTVSFYSVTMPYISVSSYNGLHFYVFRIVTLFLSNPFHMYILLLLYHLPSILDLLGYLLCQIKNGTGSRSRTYIDPITVLHFRRMSRYTRKNNGRAIGNRTLTN